MKIKKLVILILLIFHFGFTRAQHFFYIDQNHITESLLKGGLLKSAQYITNSPLSSDYTIKTNVGFPTDQKTLTLSLDLQDSLTAQMIFQVRETYALENPGPEPQQAMKTIIQAFIQRNINQLVLSAKENHFDNRMNNLKSRKDKT